MRSTDCATSQSLFAPQTTVESADGCVQQNALPPRYGVMMAGLRGTLPVPLLSLSLFPALLVSTE